MHGIQTGYSGRDQVPHKYRAGTSQTPVSKVHPLMGDKNGRGQYETFHVSDIKTQTDTNPLLAFQLFE